jgi:hypothetical protein
VIRQTNPRQQRFSTGHGILLAAAFDMHLREREIVEYAQVRKEFEMLEYHAHARTQSTQVATTVMYGYTIDLNFTAVDSFQTIDRFDERGFTGARGAADDDNLTTRHRY